MHYTYIKPNPNTPFLLPYMFWPRTPPPHSQPHFSFLFSHIHPHIFALTSHYLIILLFSPPQILVKPSWICTKWVLFVPLSFPANSLLFRRARAANDGWRWAMRFCLDCSNHFSFSTPFSSYPLPLLCSNSASHLGAVFRRSERWPAVVVQPSSRRSFHKHFYLVLI